MPVGPSGPVVRSAHPATTTATAAVRPKTLPRPSPVRRRPAHPGPAQGRRGEPDQDEGVVAAVADQDQETGDTDGAVRRPQEEDTGQARPGRRLG